MMITRIKATLTDSERVAGIQANQLLELWVEIGPSCHLRCNFCFNRAGGTVCAQDGLVLGEYLDVLRQFKGLGGRVIGIPGFGEPFHPRNLECTLRIAKYAQHLGLRCYIFTSGDLIDERLGKELKELDVSLLIKWNSFNPDIQDRLVRSKGYADRRGKALDHLFKLGFNLQETDSEGNQTTMLGFVTSVLLENHEEIPRIFRYCRENNIYPDIDSVLPLGRAESLATEEEVEMTRQAFLTLQEIDQREYGNEWEVLPMYVVSCCSNLLYHMYLDYRGNVSPCIGLSKRMISLGNIRQNSLAQLWDSPLMLKIRRRDYTGECAKCQKFISGVCNSCLGRYTADATKEHIRTVACWCFEP